MKPRQDRPRLTSRVSTVVGIGALVAVAMAARSQGAQQSTAAAQPPAAAPAAMPIADSTMPDTTRADSAAMANSMAVPDSTMMMQSAAAAAPAPQPSGTWPVDPVTGQTLVNGVPVVGRVFIMQRPDGLVKLGTWQHQYVGEAMMPEPAHVGSSHVVPAMEHTRRIRTVMVQATLWAMDGKRSARERHYYRAQTTGAALGQQ